MRAVLKAGLTLAGILATVAVIHEVRHFRRYGHLAPFGLHADFTATTSHDILAVGGTATIYQARLTNYGVFPAAIVVCDYLDYASMHQTMVNYVVERRRSFDAWEAVPEWSEYGSRLFCRLLSKLLRPILFADDYGPAGALNWARLFPLRVDFALEIMGDSLFFRRPTATSGTRSRRFRFTLANPTCKRLKRREIPRLRSE